MDDRVPALREYVTRHQTRPTGPTFVRYHMFPSIGPNDDVADLEADVEQGFPVMAALPDEGPIRAAELPHGRAVTANYIGVPKGLGAAYASISAWMQENNQQPSGPAWEIYHFIDFDQFTKHASLPDPATWHHQIVQPIT